MHASDVDVEEDNESFIDDEDVKGQMRHMISYDKIR
jgi:hypothetical protein